MEEVCGRAMLLTSRPGWEKERERKTKSKGLESHYPLQACNPKDLKTSH
jgi:hypothetical protein